MGEVLGCSSHCCPPARCCRGRSSQLVPHRARSDKGETAKLISSPGGARSWLRALHVGLHKDYGSIPCTAGMGSAQALEQGLFFQGTGVPGAAGQEGPHPPQLHPPGSGAKSGRAKVLQLCTKINPVPREPCMGSWGQVMATPATSPLVERTHFCGAV